MLFLEGNVIDCLRSLPEQSVHCVITSPPYMGLRDYGLPPTKWPSMDYYPIYGFTQHIDEETVCLGLEKTPESYIGHLVLVFRELWRVLRDDGIAWLNLGDSFACKATGADTTKSRLGGGKLTQTIARNRTDKLSPGLKPKDLMMAPSRVALALQADGWYLRSDIVWAKGASGQGSVWGNVYEACLRNGLDSPTARDIADSADPFVGNPMPESVKDRPARSHEHIFLLAKSQRYFYDHIAVQEDCVNGDPASPRGSRGVIGSLNEGLRKQDTLGRQPLLKRNRRDTWVIPTQAFPDSHFAVFPESLVEPCILAGTSQAGCCPKCGTPWERVYERMSVSRDELPTTHPDYRPNRYDHKKAGDAQCPGPGQRFSENTTLAWHPSCSCGLGPIPCTTLDPFGGSGTVAKASRDLGRESVYIDLNPDYVRMAIDRVGTSLFNSIEHRKVTTTPRSKE